MKRLWSLCELETEAHGPERRGPTSREPSEILLGDGFKVAGLGFKA